MSDNPTMSKSSIVGELSHNEAVEKVAAELGDFYEWDISRIVKKYLAVRGCVLVPRAADARMIEAARSRSDKMPMTRDSMYADIHAAIVAECEGRNLTDGAHK